MGEGHPHSMVVRSTIFRVGVNIKVESLHVEIKTNIHTRTKNWKENPGMNNLREAKMESKFGVWTIANVITCVHKLPQRPTIHVHRWRAFDEQLKNV